MKKILFLTYAALALFALSCTKEEDLPAPSPNEGKTFVSVGGSRELPDNGTKSQMADNGAFSWTYYSDSDENNDAILICGYNSSNGNYTFSEIGCVGYPDPEEKKNARFSGWVTGTIQDYAVFPATLGASFNGTTLTLNLPNEITWKEGEADNLMVAPTRTYANGVHNFSFYNVAGLFKVTLNGLPSTARKVSFYAAKSFAEETPKKITGNFSINMSAVNVEGTEKVYPQITTETATTDDFVTIKWSDAPAESMVFYVPVPTGEYTGFSFRVKDAEDNVLASFKGKTAKSVTRGKLIILPALTMTTAGGGGDNGGSKLVVPHNYTANNGVFVLPETSSDIELDIESNNEVTIAYSSENAEKKPANVYMTVLGDVNSLTINLPDSHVELGGQVVNNNNYTITNLTSNTSVSTLLVNKTVKIGKSDVEGSGITVTGGSLNLTAPVEGTVKVAIPENVLNTTEEKVSININSSIQKLDVDRAANKDVANKIYVTLAPPTNQTQEQPVVVELSNLTVTETNCNLYVAPGVQVTTVTTSASENTIEGTVTDTLTAQPDPEASEPTTVNVTVTGAVENLAATGAGTTVTVTSDATVSDYISADSGATVIVDSEATVTNNTNDNNGNGTIATVDSESVAIIGTVNYTTLDSAIEAAKAAESGATINMLKDVEISDKLIVALENKSVTLNLGGNTLTGRVNLTNGNLTVKNGSVKNVEVEGQPLNVYGSSTPGAQNYSVLNVASDVTVEGHYGICVFGATASTAGYGAVVNFAGKIKANDGIFVSGNLGNNIAADMNNVVNVTGKIEGTETGIALNGWATVNVQDGANISANTGIAVKRGVLNVADGATVTGNGTWIPSPNANNNGTELTGAAVSMTNTYNQYGAMAVNIAGGNFTSVNGQALLKADQNYTNAATFTVTGGTFSSDPSAYVADGYEAVQSSNVWTIESNPYVAKVGSDYYTSLDSAIEAANNATVTILKNINIVFDKESYISIPAGKTVTIDLAGHTVTTATTRASTSQLIENKGNLTITDSKSGGTLNHGANPVWIYEGGNNYNGSYASNIITNKNSGIVVLEKATINQLSQGSAAYIVDNYNSSSLTILSGTYEAAGTAFRLFNSSSVMSVKGGTITSINGYAINTHTYASSSQRIEITGGTINAPTYCLYAWGGNDEAVNSSDMITISGGTFNNWVATGSKYPANGITITDGTFYAFYTWNAECKPIMGGTFSVDPSSFVKPGYEAYQEDDVWKIREIEGVAQIGTTPYATLEAAFAAANAMETEATITLMSDVTITENNIVVGGTHGATASVTASVNPVNITFDLNNHNITGTKTIYLVGGSLNITGTGTIETTNEGVAAVGVRYVKSTGELDYTSKRTLTIGQNVTLKGAKYGLNVFGTNEGTVANNIEVNVNGTIKGDLFVLGNLSNQSNTIDINVNGTIDASAVDMNGIALNGYANVTVGANAVVKGNTGIEVRAGRLVVNGGEITATSEFSIASNGSGTSTKGAAVAVSQHTTNLPCSAIISGGTFTGAYALYEKDVEIAPSDNITLSVTDGTFNGNIYSKDFTHFISGGIFSVDPSAYVANGYAATQSENVWTVEEVPVIWANLAASDEEFAAATNGKVISISTPELLAKLAANVNSGTNYTGYTINLAGNIDLQNIPWTPIGTSDNPFKGTFDGCSNTISNLKVTSEVQGSGLFGVAGGSTIKDLRLDKVNILSTTSRVGALLGMATWSTNNITGITVTDVTIKASGHIGGIIGHLSYSGTVNNLNVSGKLIIDGDSESWDNGAICGYVGYTSFSNCWVEVDNTSLVSGGYHIGGMFGYPGEGGTTFTDCYTNVNVKGLWHVGGLIGNAQYGNNYIRCTVDNVTVTSTDTPYSDASATMDKYACGLFAGVAMSGSAITVNNCTFSGTLVSNVAIYDQGYYGYGYDGNYTVPTVNLTNGTTITLNN